MIENAFRRYIVFETTVGAEYDFEYLKTALTDDDIADDLWTDFEKYNGMTIREMVREQVKSVVKKPKLP